MTIMYCFMLYYKKFVTYEKRKTDHNENKQHKPPVPKVVAVFGKLFKSL